MATFNEVILLFFMYSFVGWLWETIYCSIKAGHFVYRGFLLGPITPIYGFGILGVLYFVEPFQNNLVVLYVLATVLVTLLEYLTSYALEKLFHATWWDYKDVPLNINGRVALPVSLFWGACCVLIVKVVNPEMVTLETHLARQFGVYLPILLIVITLADLAYTLHTMHAFAKVSVELNQAIDEAKATVESTSQTIAQTVGHKKQQVSQRLEGNQTGEKRDWLKVLKTDREWKNKLPKLSFHQKRLMESFPNLRIKNVSNMEDFRRLFDEIKSNK